MSDWGWYRSAPKKAPPKRGIKMQKSGVTWWGQRWIEALEEMSAGYSNRLARGRTYARAGRTHDLEIQGGEVAAKVTGSRSSPYQVAITLLRLSDRVWDKAIAAMAEKAQFSAELLAGEMPQEIDAVFKLAGASLFPVSAADLRTSCSCPDYANPCKHVAATHYVLGEAFDRDPFLLFELRGRSKDQVLDALRVARVDGGDLAGAIDVADAAEPFEVPTLALGRIKAADWDRPRKPLPELKLLFAAPSASGALLRQLGMPAGWSSEASPAEALGPTIRAAAERARTMAMAEVEPVIEADRVLRVEPLADLDREDKAAKKLTKKGAGKKKIAKKSATKKIAKKLAVTKAATKTITKKSATKKGTTKKRAKKIATKKIAKKGTVTKAATKKSTTKKRAKKNATKKTAKKLAVRVTKS